MMVAGSRRCLRSRAPWLTGGRAWSGEHGAWSQRNSGEDVLAYAGIFRDSREESARIMETIDRDCGQVRKEDWLEGGDRG
jgi:hypothetical protein